MPRQVIIGMLVVLILGVLGGTVAIIINRLRVTGSEAGTGVNGNQNLPEAETGSQLLASGDEDGDGLPNADEARWRTDPRKADTDGDGFQDGQEVTARHNPTVAGPNDTLPEGFTLPGEETPITSPAFASFDQPSQLTLSQLIDSHDQSLPLNASQPLNVDQYFAEGVNFHVTGPNLTEQYNSQTGGQGTQQDLINFVKAQPIQTKLSRIGNNTYTVKTAPTRDEVAQYLRIAYNEDVLRAASIAPALENLVTKNEALGLTDFYSALQEYQRDLTAATSPIPFSAEPLHRLLLAYTDALVGSFQKVLAWNQDKVSALVAIRQIDALDRTYSPLIQAEIERLGRESL